MKPSSGIGVEDNPLIPRQIHQSPFYPQCLARVAGAKTCPQRQGDAGWCETKGGHGECIDMSNLSRQEHTQRRVTTVFRL
jgi:hypothetical protein